MPGAQHGAAGLHVRQPVRLPGQLVPEPEPVPVPRRVHPRRRDALRAVPGQRLLPGPKHRSQLQQQRPVAPRPVHPLGMQRVSCRLRHEQPDQFAHLLPAVLAGPRVLQRDHRAHVPSRDLRAPAGDVVLPVPGQHLLGRGGLRLHFVRPAGPRRLSARVHQRRVVHLQPRPLHGRPARPVPRVSCGLRVRQQPGGQVRCGQLRRGNGRDLRAVSAGHLHRKRWSLAMYDMSGRPADQTVTTAPRDHDARHRLSRLRYPGVRRLLHLGEPLPARGPGRQPHELGLLGRARGMHGDPGRPARHVPHAGHRHGRHRLLYHAQGRHAHHDPCGRAQLLLRRRRRHVPRAGVRPQRAVERADDADLLRVVLHRTGVLPVRPVHRSTDLRHLEPRRLHPRNGAVQLRRRCPAAGPDLVGARGVGPDRDHPRHHRRGRLEHPELQLSGRIPEAGEWPVPGHLSAGPIHRRPLKQHLQPMPTGSLLHQLQHADVPRRHGVLGRGVGLHPLHEPGRRHRHPAAHVRAQDLRREAADPDRPRQSDLPHHQRRGATDVVGVGQHCG